MPADEGAVPAERKDGRFLIMYWTVLISSGTFEAMWAFALAARHLRIMPRLALFIIGAVVSMAGLTWGLQEVPVGSGYAVWVAVGAVTTLALGALRGTERLNLVRIACVAAIIAGVVGLQVLS